MVKFKCNAMFCFKVVVLILSILTLRISVLVVGQSVCPVNFFEDEGQKSCWGVSSYGAQFEFQCFGNQLPIDFFERLAVVQPYLKLKNVWTDLRRMYIGGPFINYRYGDENMGEPYFHVDLWRNETYDQGKCSVYDFEDKKLKAVDCNNTNPALCVVPQYTSPLEKGSCKDNFFLMKIPKPLCLSKIMKVSNITNNNYTIAKQHCEKIGGNIVQNGYIYANNEFIMDKNTDIQIPVVMDEKEALYRCETTKNLLPIVNPQGQFDEKYLVILKGEELLCSGSNITFTHVMCEHSINISRSLVYPELLETTPLTMQVRKFDSALLDSDVWCFGQTTYKPVRMKTTVKDNKLTIDATDDGYYMCNSNNTIDFSIESGDNLYYWPGKSYISDAKHYAVMLNFNENFKEYKKCEFSKSFAEKLKYSFFDTSRELNITKFIIRRCFVNRDVLLHIYYVGDYSLRIPSNSDNFTVKAVVNLKCDISTIPADEVETKLDIFKPIYNICSYKLYKLFVTKKCETLVCLQDYIDWSNLFPANSTTESSEWDDLFLISLVGNKTSNLVNSQLWSNELRDEVFYNVHHLFLLHNRTNVPHKVFLDMDVILLNAIIDTVDKPDIVTIAFENMTVSITDEIHEYPIYGVKIEKSEISSTKDDKIKFIYQDNQEDFGNDLDKFDVLIKLPKSLSAMNNSRIAVLLLENDNLFSQKDVVDFYKLNSKIVKISTNGSLKIGDFIDIHFRPLSNLETKVCGFWDFKENGYDDWSTEGCEMLSVQLFKDFDTCRCSHLSYFAVLSYIESSGFGAVNWLILSIVLVIILSICIYILGRKRIASVV